MSTSSAISFASFLEQHDDKAWADVVGTLLPAIHEVDRNATRIWFAFYPLAIPRALAQATDPSYITWKLQLQGTYGLADQIDTSHAFLYGHRYWPQVKRAVVEHAADASGEGPSLVDRIREVAATAAKAAGVETSLTLGITAVAFMTLEHVGFEAFAASPGTIRLAPEIASLSPAKVIEQRKKVPGQGFFGFLRSVDRRWTVTFDETRPGCTMPAVNGQDLAMASAEDTRDYSAEDPRRVEGPIPVECRTAACGTCWVGVIAGAENLSEVDDREWRKMKEFGYLDTDDPQPHLRLACRAKAQGPVTIVIPPWNGVFGKLLEGKIDLTETKRPR